MDPITRPLFALYVVWHPSYENGSKIADLLRRRFGGDRYQNIAGDSGVSVLYRSDDCRSQSQPMPGWSMATTEGLDASPITLPRSKGAAESEPSFSISCIGEGVIPQLFQIGFMNDPTQFT